MKKTYTLILIAILILFTKNVKGVWIDQGAIWHYDYNAIISAGFKKITYASDTVILGKTCQHLQIDRYEFTSDQFHVIHYLGKYPEPSQFTYVSGDTVFYYQALQNKFYVLYNFGASPGDTWDLGIDTNSLNCSASYAHVDSVGTIFINGQNHRWISLSPTSNSSIALYGKAIERFGASENYLFPVDNNCDSTIVVDWPIMTFTCYEDNSFQLYKVIADSCEYWFTLDVHEINGIKIQTYPNPSSGIINIEMNSGKSMNVKIYSLTGNLVLEQKDFTGGEVNLASLSGGMYILELGSDNGGSFLKKIILY